MKNTWKTIICVMMTAGCLGCGVAAAELESGDSIKIEEYDVSYMEADARPVNEENQKEHPEKEKAEPVYIMPIQYLESGKGLGSLKPPQTAKGVNGENIPGRIIWSPDPEFSFVLDNHMPLSGKDGEILEFYWKFIPAEGVKGYGTTEGEGKIIFGRHPENVYEHMADELMENTAPVQSALRQESRTSGSVASTDSVIILGEGGHHTFVPDTPDEIARHKKNKDKKQAKSVKTVYTAKMNANIQPNNEQRCMESTVYRSDRTGSMTGIENAESTWHSEERKDIMTAKENMDQRVYYAAIVHPVAMLVYRIPAHLA
ncbi:MAG: hypothetical protein Q4B57_10990 [Eubacteriales bacterium]|nr:hypothetical protein [Eubacteriales bacterium]